MTPPRRIRLVLPYPPSANNYWRSITIRGQGRVIVSAEARAYKAAVTALARGYHPLTGPLELLVRVYRPRRVGDLDNTLKVLADALKGACFEDDSQIERIRAERYDDKTDPRAELELTELGAAGLPLFQSKE